MPDAPADRPPKTPARGRAAPRDVAGTAPAGREARLAAALRANLARRKAQKRARDGAETPKD